MTNIDRIIRRLDALADELENLKTEVKSLRPKKTRKKKIRIGKPVRSSRKSCDDWGPSHSRCGAGGLPRCGT